MRSVVGLAFQARLHTRGNDKLKLIGHLVLWLLLVANTAGAQTPSSRSYGFVSPNTRENLKIEEAIANLNSAEESELVNQAKDLACRVRFRLLALRAVGSWSDGAEHSVVLQLDADEPTLRYLLSKLGQAAEQKAVLYFQQGPKGPASLYILRAPTQRSGLRTVAKLLDQSGIAFRTLVPTRKAILIFVVDLKNELRAKMTAAARRLKASLSIKSGNAEFIGDDSDRQKAKTVFQQAIVDYETRHPNLPATCRKERSKVTQD